jgi:hypothetical protein
MAAPTTNVDICRKALRECHSTDSLPATMFTTPVGKAAILCAEFYDDARKEVLRLAPWTCIIKRSALAKDAWESGWPYAVGDLIYAGTGIFKCTTAGISGATAPTWPTTGTITDGTAVWTWQGAFIAAPGDNYTSFAYVFAMPSDYINIVDVIDAAGNPVDHYQEKGLIYTDESAPILVYVPNSETVTDWDSLLAAAMVYYLASKIAYPLQGSHDDERAALQKFNSLLDEAAGKTKREKAPGPPAADPWYEGLFT